MRSTLSAATLSELATKALAGGFTYSVARGHVVTAGIAVANPDGALSVQTLNPDQRKAEEAIRAAVEANRFLLASPDYCLGAWLDGSRLYVEVSEVFRSDRLHVALLVASQRGELAVFNLQTLQEIRLDTQTEEAA